MHYSVLLLTVMIKSVVIFVLIFKDDLPGLILSVLLNKLTHLVLPVTLGTGTGSSSCYRKEKESIDRLNNLSQVIQLL